MPNQRKHRPQVSPRWSVRLAWDAHGGLYRVTGGWLRTARPVPPPGGPAVPGRCRGWPGTTSTRVSATARYRVSFGDRDLLLVEGDIAAVVLSDAVEGRWVGVWVTPRCVVMARALHGDVVILGDALPGAGIRCRAVTERAGGDRGGREVVVALYGDQVRLRSIRHNRVIDDGLHVPSLLAAGRFSCVNPASAVRLPGPPRPGVRLTSPTAGHRGSGGQMTGSDVQEIVPGIWCWQRRPRGLRASEFGVRTSYALGVNGETLLVDPLVVGDDDPALGALDDLAGGRVRILVSKPFHTRSSELRWRRYNGAQARIYGHAEVATRVCDTSGFEAVRGGDDVGGVARFHPIGVPPRSEQPIEIPALGALVFGDAVVETGGGELRVWENPVDSERRRRWWRERYLPTLERVAAVEPEHVLATHGQPILGRGAAALRRALERDPWQRPKRRG